MSKNNDYGTSGIGPLETTEGRAEADAEADSATQSAAAEDGPSRNLKDMLEALPGLIAQAESATAAASENEVWKWAEEQEDGTVILTLAKPFPYRDKVLSQLRLRRPTLKESKTLGIMIGPGIQTLDDLKAALGECCPDLSSSFVKAGKIDVMDGADAVRAGYVLRGFFPNSLTRPRKSKSLAG